MPWPVVQERSLARALEHWRIIVSYNLEGSEVGRQIHSILGGTIDDMAVEQVIRDSLAGKAVSTLRSRSSSIMALARWKKSSNVATTIFPVTEEEAYRYVLQLRQSGAPRTRASRFLESVAFAGFMWCGSRNILAVLEVERCCCCTCHSSTEKDTFDIATSCSCGKCGVIWPRPRGDFCWLCVHGFACAFDMV